MNLTMTAAQFKKLEKFPQYSLAVVQGEKEIVDDFYYKTSELTNGKVKSDSVIVYKTQRLLEHEEHVLRTQFG